MPPYRIPGLRLFFLTLCILAVPPVVLAALLPAAAMAQDDDGDDDDDDDDDDDGGSASDDGADSDDDDRVETPTIVRRPRPASAPYAAPLLEQAPDQIVLDRVEGPARAALIENGFTILRQVGLRLLLQVPAGLTVDEALILARALVPAALAAPNSYYRSQAIPAACEGALCPHWEAVGWPPVAVDPLCRFEPRIGVIDTGVNLQHDMLSKAAITLETIGSAGAEPSERRHGTAVVALFVGDPDGRVPGLVPAAEVLVVDPFGRVGGDERSDVFSLVTALERLASAEVGVASLSLAGPANPLLEQAVARTLEQGIPVVAAVGNAGARAEPLYPASYPGVVGVTAVDTAATIYRRAVQGAHVSFAGPGVAIPTAASISGVRPQTGTSFAVPFVTTALAAAMADGSDPATALQRLAASSRDLGERGRDSVFGWGLVQIPDPC